MAATSEHAFDAMRAVRDRALLLGLGKDYLCKPPFLKRYGRELKTAISALQEDVQVLKNTFPARFVQEIDTDQILKGMRELAHRLETSDPDTQDQCMAGRVGQDLEARLKGLSDAVKGVRVQVEGNPQGYTGADAVAGAVVRAGGAFRSGLSLTAKVVGLVLVLGIAVFSFLFLTMEREGDLEETIARNQTRVQELQRELDGIESRLMPLEDRLEFLESRIATRDDRVRFLELELELGKLEEKERDLEGEIERHRQSIREAEETLRRITEKGFLGRLMRQ